MQLDVFIKTVGDKVYNEIQANITMLHTDDSEQRLAGWVKVNNEQDSSAATWVSSAFIFSKSKEGNDYWMNISKKLLGDDFTPSTTSTWKAIWYSKENSDDTIVFNDLQMTEIVRMIQKNDYSKLEISNQ